MKQLAATTIDSTVSIALAVTALAFPPTTCAFVPAGWSSNAGAERWSKGGGVIPEFDLEIWSTGSLNLTVAELLAGKPRLLVTADVVPTAVTNATDLYTKTAHGLLTGDGPFHAASSGTLPAGLAINTNYWVIKVDADTFKVAASLADALAATPVPVDISTNGTGTLTFSDAGVKRIYWHSLGALPTPIALTNQRAYIARYPHRPDIAAYALVGTLSTGVVSASITPVLDNQE